MSKLDDAFRFESLDSFEGVGAFVERKATGADLFASARKLAPGVTVAGIVALAASWLSDHYHAPVMLFALLLGIAVNFASQERSCRPGIEFTSRFILRVGVALLGARITLLQVQSLGLNALIMVAAAVMLTIIVGRLAARRMNLSADFGILTGGAVAICGASAALAISSILPESKTRERDTILTVVGVTGLSTIAMVVYPIFAQTIGLGEHRIGLFLGATIHDVAQVVGAGYSVSPLAGDTATLVKLFRVAMLLPAVMVIGLLLHTGGSATRKRPPLLPGFLVGFAVLVIVNSLGVIPAVMGDWLSTASRWCLVAAISALGTKTSLGAFVHVGWRPILLIVIETLFVFAFILTGMALNLA